jgi:hypothetical protein
MRAFVAVAAAGLIWFAGDLYDLWLARCQQFESRIYNSVWVKVGNWLGLCDMPTEATITPVFTWIDFIGDIGFFLAIGLALLWIYCDSYCLATEQMASSLSPSPSRHRDLLYTHLLRTLVAALVVAIVTYEGAWWLCRNTDAGAWLLDVVNPSPRQSPITLDR